MSQGLDNLRIVIVDGQKHVRSALTGFLSGLGSIVRERANADDVMTPRFQPDLVLSDIAMPDKDGFEFVARDTPFRLLSRGRCTCHCNHRSE